MHLLYSKYRTNLCFTERMAALPQHKINCWDWFLGLGWFENGLQWACLNLLAGFTGHSASTCPSQNLIVIEVLCFDTESNRSTSEKHSIACTICLSFTCYLAPMFLFLKSIDSAYCIRCYISQSQFTPFAQVISLIYLCLLSFSSDSFITLHVWEQFLHTKIQILFSSQPAGGC